TSLERIGRMAQTSRRLPIGAEEEEEEVFKEPLTLKTSSGAVSSNAAAARSATSSKRFLAVCLGWAAARPAPERAQEWAARHVRGKRRRSARCRWQTCTMERRESGPCG